MKRSLSLKARAQRTLVVTSLGALATLGFAVAPALAAPGTVTVVTHTMDHPDTTSATGPCTGTSPNGPTWATDNLSLNYRVTATGANTYSVMITAHGSFSAFADPTTGACYSGHGSVDGWLEWDVTSSIAPDPASVPAQENGALGQTSIMLNQLFDGHATITGGGHYDYSYNLINGARYAQVG
ncbi:MAG TPA: hypothetical protein VMU98_06270 [Acidimicrobiales bacterium]|nr:hypothetical protein [Acidimicrobiales bacterium]